MLNRLFAVIALPLVVCSPLHAEVTNCTPITTVPFVVTKPGIYCLTGNQKFDPGNAAAVAALEAINVQADFVTLDLNGWMIDGRGFGLAGDKVGIRVPNGQHYVTIRNGTVNGFRIGVAIGNWGTSSIGLGHLVENLAVFNSSTLAISTSSDNSVIRNNRIDRFGGYPAVGDGIPIATAIMNTGRGNRILGNEIANSRDNAPPVFSEGIASFGDDTVIAGNRLVSMYPPAGVKIQASGSLVALSLSGANVIVADNDIVCDPISRPVTAGIVYDGISAVIRNNSVLDCTDGISMTGTAIYSGNHVLGAAKPYIGGTAHGTTNTP